MDARNVSGFRYACEGVVRGAVSTLGSGPGPAHVHVFACGPAETVGRSARALVGDAKHVTVHDVEGPADRDAVASVALDVVHEVEMDVTRALAMRATFAGAPPLTLGTHGNFTGIRAAYGVYLPLILGGSRACDAIVCASEASRRATVQHLEHLAETLRSAGARDAAYPGDVVTVPYGVDTQVFAPASRDEARAYFGWPDDARIALWHGRVSLANKQDPSPVLLVLRRLLGRHPTLRLVVSAPSTDAPGLAVLRARAVQLGVAGALEVRLDVPRADQPRLLAAADIALCLSDTVIENFGLVAIEAMASGVPVVASEWAGFADAVEDGVSGLRVPTVGGVTDDAIDWADAVGEGGGPAMLGQAMATDCDALEAALDRVLSSPELAGRLAEGGRLRAVQRYDARVVASRLADVWAERVTRGPAAPSGAPILSPLPIGVAFAHYPSRRIRDVAPVSLTADGRALVAGVDPVFLPPVPGDPVEPSIVQDLLRALCALSVDGAVPCVGDVLLRAHLYASAAPAALAPRLRRHLLWLLKQGYVRVADA